MSGVSALKSTTKPSAASLSPSPAASTPALIIDSLYLPMASMTCSKGISLYASTASSFERMISMYFMVFSLVLGSSLDPLIEDVERGCRRSTSSLKNSGILF